MTLRRWRGFFSGARGLRALNTKVRPKPQRIAKGIRLCDGAVYVRPQCRRYQTAKQWAERRTKAELVNVVAKLFQKRAEDHIELLGRYVWGNQAPVEDRMKRAKAAAIAKLERDPKQAAKREAFKLWQDWQAGRTLHKSGAAFARHVVDSLPIESTKTMERWMKQWREEMKK